MIFKKLPIEGAYLIELEPKEDFRGYFTRVFGLDELSREGIPFEIVQINRSLTLKKGTIRGMHYQNKPKEEDKLVQCLSGEIFDVLVDLRKDSKTYKQWYGEKLSFENRKMLLVPKGCAHGFQALQDNCLVEYFVSEYYSSGLENGIRWNDPQLAIQWPINDVIATEKDKNLPTVNTL